MGLELVVLILQLFTLGKNCKAILLTIRINDILLTGTSDALRYIVHKFEDQVNPREVVYGPDVLQFYKIDLIKNGDYSVTIQADNKLNAIDLYHLCCTPGRQVSNAMNEVERWALMSISTCIGWFRITASPLSSFYISFLQQKISSCHVSALFRRFTALKGLKGTAH